MNKARKAIGEPSAVNKVRSEEWFSQLYRGLPSREPATGIHCCGGVEESFLQQLARKTGKPSLLDPRIARVIDCPECQRRLEELRQQAPVRTALLPVLVTAIALAIAVAAGGLWEWKHRVSPAQTASTTRIVDLSSYASIRNGSLSDRGVSLPKATIMLVLILPAESHAGEYRVAVSPAQKQGEPLLSATGTAIEQDYRAKLSVTLDIQSLKPGNYILSTINQDGVSHDYPLELVP